jgi:hypothetical protein
MVVDSYLTKFVDNNGSSLAVVGCKDTVQEGGLPGSEKAGKDGYGDPVASFSQILASPDVIIQKRNNGI